MGFLNLPGTLIVRMLADDVYNTEQQTVQKLNDGDMVRVIWKDGKWIYERITNHEAKN